MFKIQTILATKCWKETLANVTLFKLTSCMNLRPQLKLNKKSFFAKRLSEQLIKTLQNIKRIFRALSNIQDGAFLRKRYQPNASADYEKSGPQLSMDIFLEYKDELA